MRIFNRRLSNLPKFFGSSKQDMSIEKVTDLKQNKQLRDKLHFKFLDEECKQTFYQQSRTRKTFSLYNIMSNLPTKFAQQIAKLSSDPKVILRSDNLYLPRLTAGGVPVYDSIRTAKTLLLIRSAEKFVPLYFIFTLTYPAVMLFGSMFAYLTFYRPVIQNLSNSFVIKMELSPQTQELLIQRIGFFGNIYTTRVRIDDIQFAGRSQLNQLFYRSTRSLIDKNLIFRIKSTRQLLTFDQDGLWYEQGINHELLV